MQVNQWRSTAHIDELNHSTQAMQSRNQYNSCKSANGGQQLALASSAKNKSCSQGINTTHASQPMEVSISHWRALPKTSHVVKESIQLMQVSQWRSAARIDELCQKQVMHSRNQFNSCESADGGQQLALTSSAKNKAWNPRIR